MTNRLDPSLQAILDRFRAGKRLGLARAISVIEDERPGFQTLLHEVLRYGPRASRVGVTGPPGAGKSSLLACLAHAYRDADEEVGVLAVDPTSPYSGGALLGDRIRMNDLATDPGIFIRSMATRGSLGGLAATSKEVVDLMDGFGLDRLLIESVGVGQTELDITSAADTVVVVLVPESGDAIQAMKAGLMEIGDIFAINKSDRPGADRLVKDVRQAIHLRSGETTKDIPAHHGVDMAAAVRSRVEEESGGRKKPRRWIPDDGWTIPVIKTVAQSGKGVPELLETVAKHRAYLEASGELQKRRRARAEERIRDVVDRTLRRRLWNDDRVKDALMVGSDAVAEGRETPYSVAAQMLEIINMGKI